MIKRSSKNFFQRIKGMSETFQYLYILLSFPAIDQLIAVILQLRVLPDIALDQFGRAIQPT
jgi:hypothetical protein